MKHAFLISFVVFVSIPACSTLGEGGNVNETTILKRLNAGRAEAESIYRSSQNMTLPYAKLYGDTQARWLEIYVAGVNAPLENNQRLSRWIMERAGFMTLDSENQRMYLLVCLAKHRAEDSEKSEQISTLIDIYAKDHGIESLRIFLNRISDANVDSISSVFGREKGNFRSNVEVFVK